MMLSGFGTPDATLCGKLQLLLVADAASHARMHWHVGAYPIHSASASSEEKPSKESGCFKSLPKALANSLVSGQ
jgi:hypothetical protein